VFPQGLKWPGPVAYNLSSCSAEVKNPWSYISTSPYVLMRKCLIKHRENFSFSFNIQICLKIFVWKLCNFEFRLHLIPVKTGPRGHSVSYPTGIGSSCPGGIDQGVKLIAHFQLLQRQKIFGAIPPLPHTHSWRSA
jgi:hypothetical protein